MTNFIFRTSFFVFFLVIGFVLLVSSVYTRENASSVVRDANTSDRAITRIDVINTDPNIVRDTEVIFSGSPRAIQASLTHKSYTQFMRSFHTARIEGDVSQKNIMHDSFDAFINSEQEKLSGLSVDRNKVSAYLDRLRAMKTTFEVGATETTGGSWWSRAWDTIQHFFSSDKSLEFESAHPTQIALPEKPARFLFDDTIVSVKNLTNLSVSPHDAGRLSPKLLSLVQFEPVVASSDSFPLVEDIQASPEAPLSDRMIEQARSLHNNPLEIVNFVRNTILYEPYYGLKKGSEGCLAELSCNDADTAALTIDLLRSAGIPARFKSSVAVFSMESLKQLLGVDTPNLVYGALAKNHVPVYIVSENEYPEKLMDADLSSETEFGLEWIYVEMFYEYDERGAHIENTLDLSQVSSTEELQTVLQQYPKKQWVPIDVVVRPTVHTKKNILADQVSFDAEDFFYAYLQYQGELSPIEKYAQDLEIASGVSIENSLSTKSLVEEYLPIIPITLPFVTAEGMDEEGNTIVATPYSSLPESLYHTVTISLKKSDSSEVVLSHTYLPWELHTAEIELDYRGYSETDQSVIDAYGGIHAVPAELVSLKAVFRGSFSEIESQNPISIGDTLILEFSLTHNGQELYTDQKFSTAGNAEGMYISLSHVRDNPLLPTDADRASSILLEGNSAIAREYLVHIAQEGKLLKQSLDYDYQTVFTRAVVTQNRILQKVNGVPTTFDFKGLTIDATTYINDYSNRGIITDHKKDFRLLWGLMASHYEGQVFTDLAGLSGISTVQGLQYAYADPQEYSVHVITSSNENVIDSLSLSSNTKANMHADVGNGNTIITPDKPVGEENWNGVLYISLDPEWTGTYAIGEQVSGNGGWTINQYTLTDWDDANAEHQYAYEYDNGPIKFIYKEDAERNILCAIKIETYNQIVGGNFAPGWQLTNHGKPCMDDNENNPYQFGNHDHSFIIATDGAYFSSQSDTYSYWKSNNDLKVTFSERYPNKNITIAKLYPYWGTYVFEEKIGWWAFSSLQSLGVYNPQMGEVYKIEGGLSDFYKSDKEFIDEFVPDFVGYPAMDKATLGTYSIKLLVGDINWSDYYQEFTAGRLYEKYTLTGGAFSYTMAPIPTYLVIPPGIYEKHIDQGGTAGMGFPMANPGWFNIGNKVAYQEFENGEIITYDTISKTASLIDKSQKVSILQNYEAEKWNDMVEGIIDSFSEADLYGLSVNFFAGLSTGKIIEILTDKMVLKFGKTVVVKLGVKFIPYVGWSYGGIVGGLALYQNYPLYQACNTDPLNKIEDKTPAYYCGRLGANLALATTGFTLDAVAGKLNKLASVSTKGLSGKSKLFTKVDDDYEWKVLKKSLIGDNSKKIKSVRNQFYELADEISDTDLQKLISDSAFSKRLMDDYTFLSFNKIAKDLNRYDHIFKGDTTGGWHYYPTGRAGSKITNKVMGKNGVYKADVEFTVNGSAMSKTDNSFFPDSWSEEKVLKSINEAYNKIINNKTVAYVNVPGSNNTYEAIVDVVKIRIYLDSNDKIISAFPLLN